ncbi:hypothetical protein SAMN05443634_11330 [Chishuiella changwenlii]|mgnify:CR=1 FL=1|jgi:hypothetical protein|uniref:Uncharacterized protein n=1 Tax=Chishuiella changwenlii TaxID=1434701 RepID=A0A1M7CCL3_9FLAO|nr:hypothetical protein [Chishuiella changwenlii]GGF06459.1 hypothetical protein GCM10010984_24670 [Chishuiella changwenlii]SHL64943.1 hypothetical protein SAMN05443634_11330 [Chishuiella changwenlii]
MKTYIYIATMLLLVGLGYNLYVMDYKTGFLAEENFRSVLGIGASACGLILVSIYFSFFKLQDNLKK